MWYHLSMDTLRYRDTRGLDGGRPPFSEVVVKGIADGAALPYEEVLVLNSFVDSMLTLRSITFFRTPAIALSQANCP